MIGQILTLDDDDWEDYWCSLVLTTFGVTCFLYFWILEKISFSYLIRHYLIRLPFYALHGVEGGDLQYYNTTDPMVPNFAGCRQGGVTKSLGYVALF